jgi:antitoxin component HigA of HigAB toxin-antitoxin module
MEARSMEPKALVGVIGSLSTVLEIINNEISISQSQAKALAELFKVDESLFT